MLCTKGDLDSIQTIDICYYITSSDHFPISATLSTPRTILQTTDDSADGNDKRVVDCSFVSQDHLRMYFMGIEDLLKAVRAPLEVLDCQRRNCEDHAEVND